MSGEADLGLFAALRILSADIAVDPIFGLYGYGADVSAAGDCYAITPHDGVFKRLNLITEKLSIELERDRYVGATLSKAKDYVGLTLQNQTLDAHALKLTFAGMKPGSYEVRLAGADAGTLSVPQAGPAVLMLELSAQPSSTLVIGTGCKDAPPSGPAAGAHAGSGGPGVSGAGASLGGPGSGPVRSGATGTGGVGNVLGQAATDAPALTAAGKPKAHGCGCQTLGAAVPAGGPRAAAVAVALLLVRSRRRGATRAWSHGATRTR
jgi:hypothetical protein